MATNSLMSFLMGKSENLGRPLYNVRVALLLKSTTFEVKDKDSTSADLYAITNLGDIIRFAKLQIEGYNLVTDQGYLLREHEVFGKPEYESVATNYPIFDVNLTINDNILGFNRLKSWIGQHEKKKIDSNVRHTCLNSHASLIVGGSQYVGPKLIYPSNGLEQELYENNGRIWVHISKSNPLILGK